MILQTKHGGTHSSSEVVTGDAWCESVCHLLRLVRCNQQDLRAFGHTERQSTWPAPSTLVTSSCLTCSSAAIQHLATSQRCVTCSSAATRVRGHHVFHRTRWQSFLVHQCCQTVLNTVRSGCCNCISLRWMPLVL